MELIILVAAAAVVGFLIYTSLNKKSDRHPLDAVTTPKTEVPTLVETAPVVTELAPAKAKPTKEPKVKATPKKPAAPKKSAPAKKTASTKKSAPAKKAAKTKK